MEARHWSPQSPLARHAAAAELWMGLTGRKSAAAFEVAKEAMVQHRPPPYPDDRPPAATPATRAPLTGAVVGGVTGAGLLGAAAHHANRGLAEGASRTPRHLAALGGGTLGAGVGATIGTGYAVHKMLNALKGDPPAKTAAAGGPLLEYLRTHPHAASAAGATLLGIPAAGAGYLHEKRKHSPGAGGKSTYEIDSDAAVAKHRAQAEHSGKPATRVDGLKERYLMLKARAAESGREDPRRAASYGAIPYGVLAGMTGATAGRRLLRW